MTYDELKAEVLKRDPIVEMYSDEGHFVCYWCVAAEWGWNSDDLEHEEDCIWNLLNSGKSTKIGS